MDAQQGAVVGFGELLWDCFPSERRPGGAPANVAFHAAQLGHPALVVSRVGPDADGEELRDHLRRHGLPVEHVQLDGGHPTGTVSVDSSDPDHPRYTIHEDVAWDHIELSASLERLAPQTAAVCFGTLAQRGHGTRESLHGFLALAGQALKVYDVNLRQRYWRRDWIERSLAAADVVKLNLDEVTTLAELLELGAPEPARFAARLLERYALELVCVTRGAAGCALFAREASVDLPGHPIEAVDAVGAGDAFTAGLISARLRGWDLGPAARLANEVGALVAGRAGAMPDVRAELVLLLQRLAP